MFWSNVPGIHKVVMKGTKFSLILNDGLSLNDMEKINDNAREWEKRTGVSTNMEKLITKNNTLMLENLRVTK